MTLAPNPSQHAGLSKGFPLLVAVLLMLGLIAAPATAQIPDTTEEQEQDMPPQTATQQAELTDATILDILMTSNEAEIRTSEVIVGEEAGAPQQPPMETPPEEGMPPEQDTVGAEQDTAVYGGEPQQDTTYADEPYEEQRTGETMAGANQSVQEFAQRMIEEHSRLNEEVQQVATNLGVQPEPNMVSEVMRGTVEGVTEELRQASPDQRDQEYMLSQVVLHQQTLNMIEHSLLPNAEDEEVANLLENAQQTVDEHLQQARDIFMEIAQEPVQPAE